MQKRRSLKFQLLNTNIRQKAMTCCRNMWMVFTDYCYDDKHIFFKQFAVQPSLNDLYQFSKDVPYKTIAKIVEISFLKDLLCLYIGCLRMLMVETSFQMLSTSSLCKDPCFSLWH